MQVPRGPCNSNNRYNHNFEGKFCWCDKAYDPENNADMVQCAACDDWFHDSCIKSRYAVCLLPSLFLITMLLCSCHFFCGMMIQVDIPESTQYSCFICDNCMEKLHHIFKFYPEVFVGTSATTDEMKDSSSSPGTCIRKARSSSTASAEGEEEVYKKTVGFTRGKWHSVICFCEECKKLYKECFCPWIFEEPDSPVDQSTRSEATGAAASAASASDSSIAAATADDIGAEENKFAPTILEQQAISL